MFPSQSGGVAPYRSDVSRSVFARRPCRSDASADVADLRRQYALLPRDSPLRESLLAVATGASGRVAAFLDPLLARDARDGILLNAQELAALRRVVFLAAADVGLDALLRAGLSHDAAHDLCGLLRNAPEDVVMTTLASLAKAPAPLANWWNHVPAPAGDIVSRDARRSLRVLQLAGYRQWPFVESVWRGAVTLAGQALRRDAGSGLAPDPDLGLALLDFLPRNPHSQRLMTTFTGEPILLFSMRAGMPVVAVEKMLALGFDANVASPEGRAPAGDRVPILPGAAPLHYAALHGDLAMIGLLAKSGADLNARDARGYSPMLYAKAGALVLYGYDAVTSIRREDRIDPGLRDATAAVVRSLHGLGADPRVCGYDGVGLGGTLIQSVLASRDGGGMDQWPEFEQLLVMLHDQGVDFDMPGGAGARYVAAFAEVNARDNRNDAIWALSMLLSKLSM
ncbi:ankyrin repeat domain-containing protein [Pandoraea fibrosis]|uniref:Uncharacterized protein n=1 Tax=Pandoraea fibrosis TaxID=1891094 RepID=A0A5E4SIF0_9BURK|nr:ankyrin repeat domain-containing protein [Pandoraea fibrosis]VVD74552.1 hypothetical protein PFI31113_00767 [Pandoraea fibrosis]